MMSSIPSNIQYFLKHYQPKMTGSNPIALKSIRSSIEAFNKQRSQEQNLRNINIYPLQNQKGLDNQLVYLIEIKGRKNSYYQHRILKFYMFVFDSFPKNPPEIIVGHITGASGQAERRFLHLNVSQNGQFCMKSNQQNEEYFQSTTLKDILLQLETSIYYPNITSSYNNQLYTAYSAQGDNSQYYKMLNAQAKLLKLNEDSESDSDSS